MFHTGNTGTCRWGSMYSGLQQLHRAPARVETARVNSENNYKRKWTGPGGKINCGSPIWWSELYFVQTGGFTSYPIVGRVEGNTSVWPQHFGISKVTRKVWTKLEAVYTYRKENVRLLEEVQQHLPATKRERCEIIQRLDVISGFYGTNYEHYILNYGTWRRVFLWDTQKMRAVCCFKISVPYNRASQPKRRFCKPHMCMSRNVNNPNTTCSHVRGYVRYW